MDIRKIIAIIGFIATATDIIFELPVAFKNYKTKSVISFSLTSYIIEFIGTICWLIYGIYDKSWQLIISSLFAIFIEAFIIYYIIKYSSLDKKNYIKQQTPDMEKMHKFRFL